VKDTAEEIAVDNKEEGGEETVTVTGAEAQAESEVTAEGEDKEPQESELELLAETEPEGEESTPEKTGEEDTAAGKAPALEKEEAVVAADPAEAEAEKIKSRWQPTRKAAMIAAGILLLIVGSVGFSVVFDLPSGDTVTSTFPGKQPENAYDMKFFLPLNVGYEEARFVKVTIAIELMDKGFKREIDKNVSKLRQEVIDLLLTKSPKEVKSAQGKNLLRQEITSRLNNYLETDYIKDTYFTELVIL
jgi:flagellar basal body-associated protein FliL